MAARTEIDVLGNIAHIQRPDYTNDPILNADLVVRDVIMHSSYFTWFLTGYNSAPIGRALDDRRRHPQFSDLVFVHDAVYGDDDRRHKGLGYFLTFLNEPIYGPDEWELVKDQYPDGVCPTEKVFYTQFGPHHEDVCRWENASLSVIVYTEKMFQEIRNNTDKFMK